MKKLFCILFVFAVGLTVTVVAADRTARGVSLANPAGVYYANALGDADTGVLAKVDTNGIVRVGQRDVILSKCLAADGNITEVLPPIYLRGFIFHADSAGDKVLIHDAEDNATGGKLGYVISVNHQTGTVMIPGRGVEFVTCVHVDVTGTNPEITLLYSID